MCNDYVVDCNDLRLPYNSREFLKKLKNVWGVNLYLSQNRFFTEKIIILVLF